MAVKIPWEQIVTHAGAVRPVAGFKVIVIAKQPSVKDPFIVSYGEIGKQLAMEGFGNITSAKAFAQSHVGLGQVVILRDRKGNELLRIEQPHLAYEVYINGQVWKEVKTKAEAVELAKALETSGRKVSVLRGERVVYETGVKEPERAKRPKQEKELEPEEELEVPT